MRRKHIVIDVEADNTTPFNGSIVCFAASLVSNPSETFYAKCHPIRNEYNPEALDISGFSRDEHLKFGSPQKAMKDFLLWCNIRSPNGTTVWSDNPAFDWMWIRCYIDRYGLPNPFGYSARRISDLACGIEGNAFYSWKHLRDTPADHNPVNDAIGNAEALNKLNKLLTKPFKF